MTIRRSLGAFAGLPPVLGLLVLLAAPALAASPGSPELSAWPQVFGAPDLLPAPEAEKPPRLAPSARLGARPGLVPAVMLGPVDVRSLLAEDEAREREDPRKVRRIGIGRELRLGPEDGVWLASAGVAGRGGGLWVGEVAATGAVGLRLHLTRLDLPAGSEIAVYAPAAADAALPGLPPPAMGGQGSGGLGRRVEVHEVHPGSPSELWTGTVAGERARLEIFVPSGGRPSFLADKLAHLYRDPVSGDAAGSPKAAGPCHNDVTCYPQWASVARAVGKITFVELDGTTSECSGELLATQAADQTPYFLTAHHCVSTAQKAATAEVFWRYQTATCGGLPPSLNSVPTSLGAALLATGAGSDFTLLMILGALPRGLFWAGWTAAPVADGTPSASIHHPAGDFKRISFGDKASHTTCGGAAHVRINWTSGPTEGGSSGGGVFRDDTQQLYGQLDCGNSRCGNVTNDDYGAFADTYPRIAALLSAGSDDDSEPNSSCAMARRLNPGMLAGRIVKSSSPDWYRVRVPPGRTVSITLSFINADGDIDARLWAGCGGPLLASSNGQTDTEILTYTNHGPAAFVDVQVYLYLGTRNLYTISSVLK
jgi:lysyl endopeptidase